MGRMSIDEEATSEYERKRDEILDGFDLYTTSHYDAHDGRALDREATEQAIDTLVQQERLVAKIEQANEDFERLLKNYEATDDYNLKISANVLEMRIRDLTKQLKEYETK